MDSVTFVFLIFAAMVVFRMAIQRHLCEQIRDRLVLILLIQC